MPPYARPPETHPVTDVCPECGGAGILRDSPTAHPLMPDETCHVCLGHGVITEHLPIEAVRELAAL